MIKRIDVGSRYSEVAVYNGVAYLAGQVPTDSTQDMYHQTHQVLNEIDKLLAKVGSHKQHILMTQIFIRDINLIGEMNRAWDEWVANGAAPPRATVEAKLADSAWLVEIVVTAAVI